VARAADPDPYRGLVREALLRRDRKALVDLAASERVASLPVDTLRMLGEALGALGEHKRAVNLLQQAQRDHPGNFWVTHHLAVELEALQPPRWTSPALHTAAVALRPDSPGPHLNLGNALLKNDLHREAIAVYQRAIQLDDTFADAHYMLGMAHYELDEHPQAIAALCIAVVRPQARRRLSRPGPGSLRPGGFPRCDRSVSKALKLRPTDPAFLCNLGHALRQVGQFKESLDHFQRGRTGITPSRLGRPSERWGTGGQRLIELETSLEAVLDGKKIPGSSEEWIEYAQVCYFAAIRQFHPLL
jgi:tetratricopeptide (TPR) repeat protein